MWDERYSESGFAYGTQPNDFLVEVGEQIPPGRVLCLAEGEGRNAVFLASRGYQVLAVDQSVVGLNKARRLAAEQGVSIETQASDLAAFEWGSESFQGIVSIWAHTPPELRASIHRECVSALAPGGVMVLEAYTPAQVGRGTGGPPNPVMCMTAEGLRQELAGLELTLLREIERDVAEGKYHNGSSCVVQMVARKG